MTSRRLHSPEEMAEFWRQLRAEVESLRTQSIPKHGISVIERWEYPNAADFVLRHGDYHQVDAIYSMAGGSAELNSLHVAAVSGMSYVEGFALFATRGRLRLQQHAWVADPRTRCGVEVAAHVRGLAYFGVEFDIGRASVAISNGHSVLNDWRSGRAVLRWPWKGETANASWRQTHLLDQLEHRPVVNLRAEKTLDLRELPQILARRCFHYSSRASRARLPGVD